MNKPDKIQIAVEVAIILMVLFLLVGLLLWSAYVLDYQLGDETRRSVRIAQITLFAFGVGLCFFICTTALGLQNYHNGGQFSRLYPAILFFSFTLLSWLTIQAINAFDLLYHGGRTVWNIARGPEISLTSLFLIICFVVIAPGLFIIGALRSAGWTRRSIIILMACILLGTIIVINLASNAGTGV